MVNMLDDNREVIHGIVIAKTERPDIILICDSRWNKDSILCALEGWRSKNTTDSEALKVFNINKKQLIEVFNTALDMIKKGKIRVKDEKGKNGERRITWNRY